MTAIWNKKARRYAGCAAAVALAFVLAVVSGCEEQKTIEPARPGSRGPTAVPAGEVRAVELPAEIVAVLEALTWTEEERDILAAVRDGDRQWRETGFFVAMQRARKVPPLPREVFSSLDSPSYSSLLLEPARYRGRPMRILANVVSVEKAEPGKDFALSRR